jgi:hypothetical protein
MCRPRHHLLGNPIRFPFIEIPGRVNREFGLHAESLLLAALAALAARHRAIAAGAFALHYTVQGGGFVRRIIPLSHRGEFRVRRRSIGTAYGLLPSVDHPLEVLVTVARGSLCIQ